MLRNSNMSNHRWEVLAGHKLKLQLLYRGQLLLWCNHKPTCIQTCYSQSPEQLSALVRNRAHKQRSNRRALTSTRKGQAREESFSANLIFRPQIMINWCEEDNLREEPFHEKNSATTRKWSCTQIWPDGMRTRRFCESFSSRFELSHPFSATNQHDCGGSWVDPKLIADFIFWLGG